MHTNNHRTPASNHWHLTSTLLLAMCALVSGAVHAVELGCAASARFAALACEYSVRDDFHTQRAICLDSDGANLEDCMADAGDNAAEAREECAGINEGRFTLCTQVNNAAHEPEYGEEFADNFVDPTQIGVSITPNPYFPLTAGNRWVYEGSFEEDGEEITERITITVEPEVKLIAGIQCIVVRDVVVIDGQLIEDTDDWFAQDIDGNVWYCGEEVKDYETFDDDQPALPELISDDGSFKAGRDGDEGGILLPFAPAVGDLFRQELSIANAEDVIEILAIDASEASPAASCTNECLQTFDFSPLDPEAQEHKFYAPGIGKILEVDLIEGTRVELIEFTVN